MHPALALYYAAALLVLAAGLPKVLQPESTLSAVREAGLPGSASLVRVFGACEIALSAGVLVIGGVVPGVLLATLYIAFAVFVLRALLRGGVSSCGCFAGDDAPPSVLHVVLNAALAGVAIWTAAAAGGLSVQGAADVAGTGQAAVLVGAAVLDAAVLFLVMARIPSTGPTPAREPLQARA